ncbi:MAG: hypothetical protein Q7R33_01915 [Nitrosarchaeum sp.]|nr:hypothetical protein [Nitrosarchaeum sp.]
MSFDTKLLRYCDHRVVEEDHVVDADLRTTYLDTVVANIENAIVKVNGTIWDRLNQTEVLSIEDDTSQVTGSNSIFVVSKVPIYDGANRKRKATATTDVIVRVTVFDEDASEQFTGTDKLLVTQHRPLLSPFNIYANQLTANDITVKVNAVVVEIESVEPIFGKIILKNAPILGDTVTVTYYYRAKVLALNAESGAITLKEKPAVGQEVHIAYFYLTVDGWHIEKESTNVSKLVFDRPKQTNQYLVSFEDVSNQFFGYQNYFYTAHTPLIPPRAKINTPPISTMITDFTVLVNGDQTLPLNIDAENGRITLSFIPTTTDVVTISYHYRSLDPADIISVDYQVSISQCRKCKRTGQVNDYDYDKLGDLITVQREQKMLQDLLKLTTAIKGSNKAHPWWGTSLVTYIGTARVPEYYIPRFKGEVVTAGEIIKDLQVQQTQYQQVDDEEFFSFLNNIVVEQSDVDPDLYEVSAIVVSQASTSIELNSSLYFNKPLLATKGF